MQKLLLLFIGIPLIEMIILVKLGAWLGFWPTILLIVLTGMLGAFLARLQGFAVWMQIRQALGRGEVPAEKVLDAFLILIAGAFLITPGVLTDIAGFMLLFAPTRLAFKRWLRRRFDAMIRRSREPGGSTDIRFFMDG